MIRPQRSIQPEKAILPLGLLLTLPFLAPALAPAQTQQYPSPSGVEMVQSGGDRAILALSDQNDIPIQADGLNMSPKQKRATIQANFAKSKIDAAELAALAKGLREALDKQKGDVLSPEIVSRADRIEKLAKKIREETKGI